MKQFLIFITAILIIFSSSQLATAKLSSIQEKPWEDFFLVIKERKFQFGITSEGEAIFHPLTRRGEIQNINNPIRFEIEVLETIPSGKTVSKQLKVTSLKSAQSAVLNPEDSVTYTGKVTGDAAFEVTIIPISDGFGITGKITDNGKLENPLNLAIRINFRPYVRDFTGTPQEIKNFDKKVNRDKLEGVVGFGDKKNFDFKTPVSLFTEFRKGVESMTFECAGYEFAKFALTTHGTSKINFADTHKILIAYGIDTRWIIPTDADPAKETLHITVK